MTILKFNKKISLLILPIIFMYSQTSPFFDGADEFDFLADINPDELNQLKTCEPNEAAAWNSLLDLPDLSAVQLLNEQFYKRTSLPRTRNIINYPMFQICSYQDMDAKNQWSIHLFYNQTSKKHYTKSEDDVDGKLIGSYINIEHKTFLSLLKSATNSPGMSDYLTPLKGFNFPLIFNDLAQAKLEERRVGGLAHYYHKISDATYFQAKLPLFWMIKNLNFTQKEKETLRQEFAAFQGQDFDETQFAKQHLIFDALGFGNLELSLDTKFLERETWSLDGGISFFLPTDVAVKKGLYGTYFEPKDQQPILSLCDLVAITTIPQPIKNPNFNKILEDYFYSALDHLSSALLQCPLGYDQTLGLGLHLSPYWKIKENLEYNSLYTVEFLLPQERPRFFVVKDKQLFSDQFEALPKTTDQENEVALNLIEQRLTSLLFPRVFCTKVFPGVIFTTASNIQASHHDWNFTAGYSSWWQTDEQFLSINVPKSLNLETLDFNKSISESAYQIQLYGKINRNINTRHCDASWTLWALATVLSDNVGNDFGIGINFDTKF